MQPFGHRVQLPGLMVYGSDYSTWGDLMDGVIETRIAALEAEIRELKKAVGDVGSPTSDRRGMIKLVAATAVGAVTGAALLGTDSVAASDGMPVVQGVANTGLSATGLESSQFSALIATCHGGVGVVADGALGNAWFPGGGKGRPGSSPGAGVVWVDDAGDWWASIAQSPFVGHWRKLAGPSSAGQLHVLPVPVRVYDSRHGEAPTFVLPKFPTTPNETRVIQTTANYSGVPLNANAVLVNLTITGPQTHGFAAAWATGTWPGTSSINFAAGQDVAGTTVVGCGPSSSIQIMSNTVTDFLVDVIGYYQ
jgi:hypothetical protein